MFSNRRPYYGLKLSISDLFREPVRYLKQSNTQESMMEKPYLIDEYPKMHLSLPDFKYRPKKRPGFFGEIASGAPYRGLAMIDFGEAKCWWDLNRAGGCIKGSITITLVADYFFTEEFKFTAQIIEDTIGVTLAQLPGAKTGAWDEQDYELTFPENSNGSVTICGFASTNTLISQTFETVVAGQPVGIYKSGGALVARERGQRNPAIIAKSSYGEKGANCGCIEFSSSCLPVCECKNIGYTTQQMVTDEVQTLTVVDPVGGCTYDWNISSGGGSLSSPTGTSVNYTAPSTNAECANNPTITLSVDGSVCDTLNIAVNALGSSLAYLVKTGCLVTRSGGMCRCTCGLNWEPVYPNNSYKKYGCDGSYLGLDGIYSCAGSDQWACGPEESGNVCSTGECADVVDRRSAADKTAGCCPAELL